MAQQALESLEKEARKWTVTIESVEIKEKGAIKFGNDVRTSKESRKALLLLKYHEEREKHSLPEVIGEKELQLQRGFKINPPLEELTPVESEWSAGRLAQLMWKYYNHDFGPVCKRNYGEYGSGMPVSKLIS